MPSQCDNCFKDKDIEFTLTHKDHVHKFCSIGCVGEYAVELVGCLHARFCLCYEGIYT